MPNLLVNAGPGCGKTHTIADAYLYATSKNVAAFKDKFPMTDEQENIYEWCREHYPASQPKAIYMAYNTEAVADIKKKVHPDCEVKTIHGWGFQAIKNVHGYKPLNDKRSEQLVAEITGSSLYDLKDKFEWISTIRFVEKLKEELLPIDVTSFYTLQAKYSELAPFKIHNNICEYASKLVSKMKQKAFDYKFGLEFIDQLWVAAFVLSERREPPYEWGFVDECQDLSPLKLRVAQLLCKNLVFVGDENQAINAWQGGDPLSISKIKKECDGVLPLNLSFRLRPNHAEFANGLRPTAKIRTIPGKADGVFETLEEDRMWDIIHGSRENNPLIVCRYNAPLAKLALASLRKDIPVRTLGTRIYDGLVYTVRNRKATSMSDLHKKLEIYEETCMKAGNESAKSVTRDKFNTIRHLLTACKSPDDFEPLVKQMLKASGKKSIRLSTVHKAKGLESETVFILNPPVNNTRVENPLDQEQEMNCSFVAHTRSKNEQYYINI